MNKTKYLNLFVYLLLLISLFSLSVAAQQQPKKKDLEKARKLIKQGDQMLGQKDYKNAIDRYSQAIAIVPTLPDAYFGKGTAHFYLKEYDQSVADLTQAEAKGYAKPIEIYKLRWYPNYEAKNYDAASKDILELLKTDSNNIGYNLAIGEIYRMKDDCANAVNYYGKVSEMDKNNSDVNYYVAVCQSKLGKTEEQLAAAREALNRKTKYVGESYYLVADALNKQKKYDEALEFYPKVIDLKPDVYDSYVALSEIYRSRSEFDKAIETSRKGLKSFPQDANLWANLAWYYSLANRPQDAVIAGKSAVTLKPDLAMAHTNLCRAYNDAKDYQQAINSCNSALRLNPGDGESYLYMGRAYEFLKQTAKAKENYEKAVTGLQKFTRENPDYSDGFYLLGNAYFALGKDDEAIAAYNKCLELSPRFARARFSLGYTYFVKGDKVKAREQYNQLKDLDVNLAEKLRSAIEGK